MLTAISRAVARDAAARRAGHRNRWAAMRPRIAAICERRSRAHGLPRALRRLPRRLAAPWRRRDVPEVSDRRGGQRPHARAATTASAASPTCCTSASRSIRRPRRTNRPTRCCAGWRRSAATARPTTRRSCASNRTAISSRSSPSTRRRASNSRSCSARSCGMAVSGSAGRSREGREYHDDAATRSSTSAPTTRSAPTRRRSTRRSGSRTSAESLRLIYVALTRAVYRCYVIAGTYRTNGPTGSPKESVQEPAQLARRRRQRRRREAGLRGHARRPTIAAAWAAPGGAPGAPPRASTPLPTEARHARVAPSAVRRESLARAAAAAADRRRLADRQLQRARQRRDAARAPRTTTTRASPSREADRSRRRRRSRPTTSCAFRAARAPASACTRSSSASTSPTPPAGTAPSPAASRASAIRSRRARGRADVAARRHGRTDAARRDVHEAARRHRTGACPAERGASPSSNSACPRRTCRHARSTPMLRRLGYEVPRLAFRDLDGYLKGFIDLVFEHDGRYYVLDWKSNHLGYAPSRLRPSRRAGGDGRARLPPAVPALRAGASTATCGSACQATATPRTSAACSTCSCAACGRTGSTATARRPACSTIARLPRPLARLDGALRATSGNGVAMSERIRHRCPSRRSPRASPSTSCAGRASATPRITRSTRCAPRRARRALPPPTGHVCTYLADIAAFDGRPRRARLARSAARDPAWSARRKRRTRCPLILDGDGRLYLHRYFDYERRLARRLMAPAPRRASAIGRRARKALLDAVRCQRAAARRSPRLAEARAALALAQRLTIISGGPGTGKTTTVVNLLACLLAGDPECRIALAAPTGKAAARMQRGHPQARRAPARGDLRERLPAESFTVHRLLGVLPDPGEFRHHAGNPLAIDVLVVDEASMLDLALATTAPRGGADSARASCCSATRTSSPPSNRAPCSPSLCADPTLSDGVRRGSRRITGIPADAHRAARRRQADAAARQRRLAHRELPLRARIRASAGSPRTSTPATADARSTLLRSGDRRRRSRWIEDARRRARAPHRCSAIMRRLSPATSSAARASSPTRRRCSTRSDAFACCAPSAKARVAWSSINEFVGAALAATRSTTARPRRRAPSGIAGRPVMVLRNDYVLKLFNGDVGIALPDATAR